VRRIETAAEQADLLTWRMRRQPDRSKTGHKSLVTDESALRRERDI
jgi:hypothetical protein